MARHKKPPPDVGFWTERDLSQAREWKRVGFSISAIAKALGKEVDKVQNKWDDDGFGLAVLPKAVRKVGCQRVKRGRADDGVGDDRLTCRVDDESAGAVVGHLPIPR